MESLLLPLVVHHEEIAAMIAEPAGMKWKDSALNETLKGRLPKSYCSLTRSTISKLLGIVRKTSLV